MSNDEKERWTKVAAVGGVAAFLLGLFVYLIGASWSLSSKVEARPERKEVQSMIDARSAKKTDVARMQQCISDLKDRQRAMNKKLDKILDRLPRKRGD